MPKIKEGPDERVVRAFLDFYGFESFLRKDNESAIT